MPAVLVGTVLGIDRFSQIFTAEALKVHLLEVRFFNTTQKQAIEGFQVPLRVWQDLKSRSTTKTKIR
jgi:hypothetical protein